MSEYEGHIIVRVEPGSIAEKMEIEAGDRLLAIDGEEIEDILDYRFLVNSESILMLIEKADGELWELDIENDYEDPGLVFENGLMSEYKHCSNKCVFCFIDQMPPGMRDTLYFKDDDDRLSFLQGNYMTLTNMKDKDIDRIIKYRMAPINISVQATNPDLRCKMLNNRFAGDSLRYLDRLYEAEIPMNGQIVLCPGFNDGDELVRTLDDLIKYAPVMESVSVVPVGLTKFRDELCPLNPVTPEIAAETIDLIERYQEVAMENWGIHFVHASDELYLLAGRELPEEFIYDGYLQLENGVGMLRLLIQETNDALAEVPVDETEEEISIATGKLAAPILNMLIESVNIVLPNKKIHLYTIENNFFGSSITVSGLITGRDLIEQLKGKPLGKRLLLPVNMFRSGEDIFLDDISIADVEKELGIKVVKQDSSGYALVDAIRNEVENE